MKKTNSTKKIISFVSSVLLAANSVAVIYAEPDRDLFDETENDVIINESEENAESFLEAADVALESEPDPEKLEGTIFYIKQYRDHVVISGIDKEAEVTDVEIPAEINGLPVTGIGSELFENRTTLKSVKFPDSITSIGARTFSGCTSLEISSLPDHITYIGTEAFKGCSQITEFTLHEGLTQINEGAFAGTSLTKVTIPSTVSKVDGGLSVRSPFKDCSTLTEVVFADGTTDIPGYILRSAEKVTKVTIPDTVISIGEYAFADTPIPEFKLPAELSIIGTSAFSDCSLIKEIELPEGLTQINSEAFAGTNLTKVTIPSTVSKVDGGLSVYSPFKGCKTLTEVVFAEGMTEIPGYILRSAEKVTKVTIPDTVRTIGTYAFSDTSLSDVKLPAGLNIIGTSAFSECSLIKEIELPEGLTQINTEAFAGTKLTKVTIPSTVNKVESILASYSPFKGCKTLTEVVFADGMTTIPAYILREAEKVTKVTIPETVTSIDTYAFSDTSLSDVKLPAGLLMIGENVFEKCSLIKEITLPEGITTLGSSAFSGTSLTKVTIPKTVNRVIDKVRSPFEGCNTLTEVVFEEGMTTIPTYFLKDVKTVEAVTIPDTVTSIGESAFANTSVSEVKLPAGLKVINERAFENCSLIKEITFPEGLTTLGSYSFEGTSLTKVTIPKTVNSVIYKVRSPFEKCNTLTDMVFEEGMETIPNYILASADTVTTVTIPKTVKALDRRAFADCSSLNTIYGIPNFDNIEIGPDALEGVDVENIKFIADIPVTAPAVTTPAAPAVTSPAVTTSAAPAVTTPAVTTSAAPAVTSPAVTTSAAPAVTTPAVTTPAAPVTTATVAPSAGVKGDVDGDGTATTTDVKNILKAIVGKIKFTEEQNKAADYNGDGAVNSADALLLLRTVVGKTEAKS